MSIKHIIIFIVISLLGLLVGLAFLRHSENKKAEREALLYQRRTLEFEHKINDLQLEIQRRKDLIALAKVKINELESRQDTLIIYQTRNEERKENILNRPTPSLRDNFEFFSKLTTAKADSLRE